MRGRRLHRLLQLIALLRGPTSWNAPRLAEHFQTSRRNVHRDLAVLELAGVPFWYDPDFGEGGGYRIRESFFFPHVGLTEQECYDFAIVARLVQGQGIPAIGEVCHVRDKLFGTLPAQQQRLIAEASELFDILSVPQPDLERCGRAMRAVQNALLTRRQLSGTYCSPHEASEVRVRLAPCRVFFANQVWYLAGADLADEQVKLYRLSRFRSLEVLKSAATAPPFSLRDFLGNAWTVYRGERDYDIEVEFGPEAAPLVAECRWHHTQELEEMPGGRLVFRATVSGLEEVKYWVLGWGPRAVVRRPLELVGEMCRLLRETLAHYEDSTRAQAFSE